MIYELFGLQRGHLNRQNSTEGRPAGYDLLGAGSLGLQRMARLFGNLFTLQEAVQLQSEINAAVTQFQAAENNIALGKMGLYLETTASPVPVEAADNPNLPSLSVDIY